MIQYCVNQRGASLRRLLLATCLSVATALAATAPSGPARAGDGHAGAIIGGIIGGAVLGSIIANSRPQPRFYYERPAPVYEVEEYAPARLEWCGNYKDVDWRAGQWFDADGYAHPCRRRR